MHLNSVLPLTNSISITKPNCLRVEIFRNNSGFGNLKVKNCEDKIISPSNSVDLERGPVSVHSLSLLP